MYLDQNYKFIFTKGLQLNNNNYNNIPRKEIFDNFS